MSAPEISVVMAARDSAPYVKDCLDSLERQSLSACAEVIVADCSADGTEKLIQTQFPNVKLLHFDRLVGLPELLRAALQEARGRIVVVTEPYCIFPLDWMEKLRQAHAGEFAVIGGAVEKGTENGLVNWACYFADYGAFMLPAPRQATPLLAGNHVSYKRDVLASHLNAMTDGFWKVFYHWDLRQKGIQFLFDPALVAYYRRRHTVAGFISGYFRHGWFFAALRTKRFSMGSRL
jgi:glycosyltransferase involved in cell wall biosynthesis